MKKHSAATRRRHAFGVLGFTLLTGVVAAGIAVAPSFQFPTLEPFPVQLADPASAPEPALPPWGGEVVEETAVVTSLPAPKPAASPPGVSDADVTIPEAGGDPLPDEPTISTPSLAPASPAPPTPPTPKTGPPPPLHTTPAPPAPGQDTPVGTPEEAPKDEPTTDLKDDETPVDPQDEPTCTTEDPVIDADPTPCEGLPAVDSEVTTTNP